jgi:hypothetical protein
MGISAPSRDCANREVAMELLGRLGQAEAERGFRRGFAFWPA